jgi:sugar phosphate isomerase/epimerase
MHRRTFVAALAAVGGIGRVPALLADDPLLSRVGLQLYTVRDLLKQDFEGTLARVAAIGYKDVEFAGYFEQEPKAIGAMLQRLGLRAPAAHVDPKLLVGDWTRIFADAKAIGHEYVVIPDVPEAQRRTIADWQRVAARLNRAGDAARHEGLTVAYHNHDYEFRPVDGRTPFDTLLDDTDPRLVKFELDLFWAMKGGADPFGLFARWPKRFRLVHAKDISADGRETDVGDGVIDWAAIVAKRKQAGIEHVFVERDEPPDPVWSATASYQYLRGTSPRAR